MSIKDKVIVSAAAAILVFGALAWMRLSWGRSAFEFANEWLYQNMGVSKAWAFTAAALAALLILANTWLLASAVLFGRNIKSLAILTACILIPGTFLYEFRNEHKCFERGTEKPLCDVYKTHAGEFVIRRQADADPPSTWIRVRTATKQDVIRFLGDPVDREKNGPQLLAWDKCGPGRDFFDRATGEPRVYVARVDERFELYDHRASTQLPRSHSRPSQRN